MGAHLFPPDAPEHISALVGSSNGKGLTDSSGTDTSSPLFSYSLPLTSPAATIDETNTVVVASSEFRMGALVPGSCPSSRSRDKKEDGVEANIGQKQETGLSLGLMHLSAETHDHRSVESNGYESDADSFTTASSFRPEGDGGDNVCSRSEVIRLQEKADSSRGQGLSELDNGTKTSGRGDQLMETCLIFGSNSMVMVTEAGDKADIAPQHQSGNNAPESRNVMAEVFHEVQRSKKSTIALADTDPLASAPAPPLTHNPVRHAAICQCGRAIESPIIPATAAVTYFRDSRHQRQFSHDRSTVATTFDQLSPSPSPAPCSLRLSPSYFVPLSSLIPSSYQASFSSWRDSFMAPSYTPLLSSNIHVSNGDSGESDDDGENYIMHDIPAMSAAATQINSTVPNGGRFHGPSHGLNNVGHHGAVAVCRLAGLVMSTSQATLNYVTDTVAPSAMRIAHQGASSTIGFLVSHIRGSSAVPSVLPRFLEEVLSIRQSANGTNPSGVGGNSEKMCGHTGTELAPNRCSRSTMDGRGFSDRMTRSSPNLTNPSRARATREISLPEVLHHRARRLADLSLPSSGLGIPATATPLTSTNRSRRTRRTTLQSIPGPEGLDPETRRWLEEQGLAALGLHDGLSGQGWRKWWDPRRYGLKKFILFHQMRTPRPCTTILLLILIVCIVLPAVYHR